MARCLRMDETERVLWRGGEREEIGGGGTEAERKCEEEGWGH